MSAATPGQAPTPIGQQAHTPGHRTPGGPLTPGAARTPGAPATPVGGHPSVGAGGQTPGMVHTPSMAYTPASQGQRLSHPTPSAAPMCEDPCRHLVYVTHFPIPQDDLCSHECNQRMILLYGVGKARDEARHVMKKITKEVMKLFSKKNSLDISSGDIGKQRRKKEKDALDASAVNFEAIFHKFQKLSYYDQHALTSVVTNSIVESFSAFAGGNSMYLPLIENISFLLDLMEYCLNINGLLDFLMMVSFESHQYLQYSFGLYSFLMFFRF